MAPKSKGTKVYTDAREFEISDEYEAFRNKFNLARETGFATVTGQLQDDEITFNVDAIVAFIPMIDLSGALVESRKDDGEICPECRGSRYVRGRGQDGDLCRHPFHHEQPVHRGDV